ncbi:hypothetical protein [Agitococcus lubricus]|uniref:Uncharacterized protein (TIGR02449 family) n=1 Tax=Agitococcus lubricus TaxID=1077255 RepID=A0A2T5IVD6_9GAMM|nr:hypothetical protein [Agitococcus lubricus]PTQ87854.1 uncharacterized protein (TIGR02449 family) [Agitococcus lubricus]
MLEQDIRALNARIDSLIQKTQALSAENNTLKLAASEAQTLRAKVETLAQENQHLRSKEAALVAERDELSRKNDLARARVEAIILRLKALETPES